MSLNGTAKWLSILLASLIALGGLLVWVGSISADAADTKRRVTTVEKRQEEDRVEAKQDQKEIKQDLKETKETVNKILIKLESLDQRRRDGR